MAQSNEVVVRVGESGIATEISARGHTLLSDKPMDSGGTGTGPTPYDYLLAALGSCTAMTIRLVADRREWPLEGVTVRLRHSRVYENDCRECEKDSVGIDQIERDIDLAGPLTEEQYEGLIRVAERCPVGQTLARGSRIVPAEARTLDEAPRVP
jgi:putative redox protein